MTASMRPRHKAAEILDCLIVLLVVLLLLQ